MKFLRFIQNLLTPAPQIRCPRCAGMKWTHKDRTTEKCGLCKGYGTINKPRTQSIP
jgi:DnaJ-class molecular chaperone